MVDIPSGEVRQEVRVVPTVDGQVLSPGIAERFRRRVFRSRAYARLRTCEPLHRISQAIARPPVLSGWTSGMALADPQGERVFVGTSPASVVCIHVHTGRVEGRLQLEESVAVKVFSVAIDPR